MLPQLNTCHFGAALKVLREFPDGIAQTCVTSPPYFGLRSYLPAGHPDKDFEIGQEKTPGEYVETMVEIFREVKRLLKDDGTLWLNLGDSYNAAGRVGNGTRIGYKQETNRACAAGVDQNRRATDLNLKPKDLLMMPARVALALQADDWYLRSDIVWNKPNPMPESVTDRPTRSHEFIFLLSKSERYYYDAAAIREPASATTPHDSTESRKARAQEGLKSNPTSERNGIRPDKQRGHSRKHAGFNDRWDGMTREDQQEMGRNKRDVWTVATVPYAGSHYATFPPELIKPCILAGSKPGDVVLDPFLGSGTTGEVAQALGRNWLGCDLDNRNLKLQAERTIQTGMVI
jgi:site-specific DNA-methyltransferase (cytosine-N4-specific)